MDTITQAPLLFIHMKNQPCHQHSETIRQHGLMWRKSYTYADTGSCAVGIHMRTRGEATQMSGMYYSNPDRWTDIPLRLSLLVTTSILVSPNLTSLFGQSQRQQLTVSLLDHIPASFPDTRCRHAFLDIFTWDVTVALVPWLLSVWGLNSYGCPPGFKIRRPVVFFSYWYRQ